MADPADLAELFDLDCCDFTDDLPFYENLARRCDGPLLELGVGTGRVALHLVGAGFEVWGIDISEAMLTRARCKAGPELAAWLHLRQADMRDFELGRTFELISSGFGTFHHLLTPEDQLACLRCVRRHLARGGLFVSDQRPWWHQEWDGGSSVPLFHDWTRVLPTTGDTVMKFRSVQADRPRQVQHETHVYDRLAPDGTLRRTITSVDLRFTNRYEMQGLLEAAGLELDQVYGDFDLSPFDDASPYLITIARRPREEPA